MRVGSEQEKEMECNKDSEADVQRVPDLFLNEQASVRVRWSHTSEGCAFVKLRLGVVG